MMSEIQSKRSPYSDRSKVSSELNLHVDIFQLGFFAEHDELTFSELMFSLFKGTLTREILPLVFFIRARPLTP
jgi:hypothetical protein